MISLSVILRQEFGFKYTFVGKVGEEMSGVVAMQKYIEDKESFTLGEIIARRPSKTQKGGETLKNHIFIDGRLLQTNKTWSHLKERQKAWIAEFLRNEYMHLAQELGRTPQKDEYGTIVGRVYEQIERRGIWIPFNEVRRYFSSKVIRYRKSLQVIQREIGLNERLTGEHNEKEINASP